MEGQGQDLLAINGRKQGLSGILFEIMPLKYDRIFGEMI